MSSLRVLHVDDEPDIREVVEMSLSLDPDLVVRSCPSGAAALEVSVEWPPDLILLDVMMPVMDGPAMLKQLRARPRTTYTPVVFMTARAQARELESFVALGAAGVIPKPFDPMTLAASVRTFVRPTNAGIAAMRGEFLERARRDAATLETLRAGLADGQQPALERIKSTAHSLGGAGGIFGFPMVSEKALLLAQSTDALLSGAGTVQDTEQALDELLAQIEQECSTPLRP